MKLVHAADLHIDSPLRGLERYEGAPVERIRQASRRAVENLIALCIEEEASLLVLAGDIFDGDWRDYGTGLFFARQLARLREAGVSAVMVRGNHDAVSQVTKNLRLPDDVRELGSRKPETVVYESLGIAVHGQSYAGRTVDADLTLGYPAPLPGLVNIGLLHTSLTGREGHADYAPTTPDRLRALRYDYWALGHVHQREVVDRDPWIVFPGNLQGRHVKEQGSKGASLVEIAGGRVTSVEHRALDVVRFAQEAVDLTDVDHVDDALEVARARVEELQEAADGRLLGVRLVFRGASRAHEELVLGPERFEAELRRIANELPDVWLERVSTQTEPRVDLAALAARGDALGALVASLTELRGDEARLAELMKGFGDLPKRLPRELAERGFRLDDPAVVAEALRDVEHMLLSRLLGRSEEP